MNFLNVCAPYVWKLPPYCQNALRSFEVLDIKITGNERLLYNAERLRSLSKLLEDKQRTATWAPMWIQVRNCDIKQPLNTPKLHRDLEIPNFDFYRKKEFSNVRKTTWFMGNEKRGFIYLAGVIGWIFGAYAVKGHGLHYVSYFGAAKDVLAMATVEVDLGKVLPGTCMSVKWRGKPLFIKNRTPREIEVEAATDIRTLRDPQSPEQRVQKQEWLIVIGICTHLGCVPMANTGDFVGGFYCPCHGSHFDNLGRARKGPAPLNLVVPPYVFLSENIVNIG